MGWRQLVTDGKTPLVPMSCLSEAKVAVHNVTPKKISLYVADAKTGDVKIVVINHASVPKYANKAVDPPHGGKYKPIGWIDTDTYKGPSDLKKYEAGDPPPTKPTPTPGVNPANFVPVFDWDEKHLWVFVKKGNAAPLLTEISHKSVKDYAGKLGWVSHAVTLIGKIDPESYQGPNDIYPLDWEPDDGPPKKTPTSADAVLTKFSPPVATPKSVAVSATIKTEPATATSPPSAQADFSEFDMMEPSQLDPNGIVLLQHKGTGQTFTLLPTAQLAQWEEDEQKYYIVTKDADGWGVDFDQVALELSEVGKPPPDIPPPDEFELPAGYKIKTVTAQYIIATTPDGVDVKWVSKDKVWVYSHAPWEQHTPPMATAAPTPLTTAPPAPKPEPLTKPKATPTAKAKPAKPKPPPKPEPPEGAPEVPKGFEYTGEAKDEFGLWNIKPTVEGLKDDGTWRVTASGQVYKYDPKFNDFAHWEYYGGKWGVGTAVLDPPIMKAQQFYDIANMAALLTNHTFIAYDPNGFFMVQPLGSADEMTMFPTGATGVWDAANQQYDMGEGQPPLPLSDALSGVFVGVFKPPEVAEEPEEPPEGVRYTGELDPVGFPVVDEEFADEDEGETGLTLLPNDQVGKWNPDTYVYHVYDYGGDDGYVPSYKGEKVAYEAVHQMVEALGLEVKGGKYHRIITPAKGAPSVPDGFVAVTPTDQEKGLVPIKYIGNGAKFYQLPGDLLATSPAFGDSGATYRIYVNAATGPVPTDQMGLNASQIKMMTKGLDPSPPEHTRVISALDINGLPMVHTEPGDPDDKGDDLTLLPNGQVARWDPEISKYTVWQWDHGDKDFYPAHPKKYYNFKEAKLLQGKKLAAVIAKPAPVKAPAPVVEPPKIVPPDPWELVPTNKKDATGRDIYECVSTKQLLAKLPVDPPQGYYSDYHKAYRVMIWNMLSKDYVQHSATEGPVWWIPGDPDVYAGPLQEGGIKGVPKPAVELKPTGLFDIHGYKTAEYIIDGEVEDTFSHLPGGKVGKWSPGSGVFLLQLVDPDTGTYYHEPGKEFLPPDWVKSKGITTVDGVAYAKLEDAEGESVYALPDGTYAYVDPDDGETYIAFIGSDGNFIPSNALLNTVKASDRAQNDPIYAMLSPTGQLDDYGFPKFAPSDDYPDALPKNYYVSLLPNGKFGFLKPGLAPKYMTVVPTTQAGAGGTLITSMAELQAAPKPRLTPRLPGTSQSNPEYSIDKAMALKTAYSSMIAELTKVAINQPPPQGTDKAGYDPNGLPKYKTSEAGIFVTVLPDGQLGRWDQVENVYKKYEYNESTGKYGLASPVLHFELSDIIYSLGEPIPGKTPTPATVAAGAAEAAKPTSAATPPSALIGDIGEIIPDVTKLEQIGTGASLGLTGAGKKMMYVNPEDGREYIFKPAVPKGGDNTEPVRAHAQEAFSAIARRVRLDHIPIKTVTIDGQLGTLQPRIKLQDPGSLYFSYKGPAQLTAEQKADVATEHVLDWLMSQHDSHSDNMVIAEDGSIYSIDKEQGFRFAASDVLSTEYHPNAQHGEEQPYYNEFWRQFADGEIDLDPKAIMGPVIEKIDAISSQDFAKTILPYAKAAFPGNVNKMQRFGHKMLGRKLNIRADFEKFLTELYTKREGEPGAFTFDDGWVPKSEWMATKTIKGKEFTDWLFSKHSVNVINASSGIKYPKPVKLLDMPEDQVSGVKAALAQAGISLVDVWGPERPGLEWTAMGRTTLAVEEEDLQNKSYEALVRTSSSYQETPPTPRYWTGVEDLEEVSPNLDALDKAHTNRKMGRSGMMVYFDGFRVEGMAGRVKRFQDKKGTYLFMQLKLTKQMTLALSSHLTTPPKKDRIYKETSFYFPEAVYDPKSDSFKESGAHINYPVDAKHFKYPEGEVYFIDSAEHFTFMGCLYIKIRSGANPRLVVTNILNRIKEGFGDQLFQPPTESTERRRKLARVIWSLDPKTAKGVSALTPMPELEKAAKAAISKARYRSDMLDDIESREVFPGYHAHVAPGRWHQLANGKIWFVVQATPDPAAVISMMRTGLMGIHERNLAGMPRKGKSYGADIRSGSGDHTLCYLVAECESPMAAVAHASSYGYFWAIVHPDQLDRLDVYQHMDDDYGVCRSDSSTWKGRESLEDNGRFFISKHNPYHEVCFRRGIHPRKILRFATNTENKRKEVLELADNAGLTHFRGVPIEDMMVVCTKARDCYEKYVKPVTVI